VKKAAAVLPVCLLFFTVSTLAQQTPPAGPKPGPEIQRLGFGLGTWKIEGETKPFGPIPGGKTTTVQTCEWFTGGFFLECHSENTSVMGTKKAIFFEGYDANGKVYTYHEFNDIGQPFESKGTVNGDTWIWTTNSKMGDSSVTLRLTVKEVSKTEFTYKIEMSQNGGEFALLQEATGRKVDDVAPSKKS
jgi:hypothetical protein